MVADEKDSPSPMEEGEGGESKEVKEVTYRDEEEKKSHNAWVKYEDFCAKSIRKWTDKKTSYLEDSALLSPFVTHRRYFKLKKLPNDRLQRILQEKVKLTEKVPPIDLSLNDTFLDPEEVSMHQLTTLEKLRFVYLLSENGQGRRSFLLNLFLSQLKKGASSYTGKLTSNSLLTDVEKKLDRQERKLYNEEGKFGDNEDLTNYDSAGSGRTGAFGYLGEGALPLYISAPVFMEKFKEFKPMRVEGKSPGAVKFLIETGIESLLSLHKGDQIADFDYNSIYAQMHHLMINPEHPLVLVVDGVEGLNRKDYGSFFHSIQLFAKIPPFVTEPPGIASVFMHDSLHKIDRPPPAIVNPTRLVISATAESIVIAKSLDRLDTRDWPLLELAPLPLKEATRFSHGIARYFGVTGKETIERMNYSLISRFAPHHGHLLLLHLLAWHESRHERQKKSKGRSSKEMIWNRNRGRKDNVAYHSSLIDFVKSSPALVDDDTNAHPAASPYAENAATTAETGSVLCSGLDDVYKDLLLCWIRKWWDSASPNGEQVPMPDDAAKWLLRLTSLFGYLNHWLEDNFFYLLDKFFKRDIKSIYGVIGSENPLTYLSTQMKAVIRVLGPISPLLQERIEARKPHMANYPFDQEEEKEKEDDEYDCCYFSVIVDLLESLVRVDGDRIEFFHTTFREYLTALFLADEHVSLPIRDKLTPSSPGSSFDDIRQGGSDFSRGISSSSPGPKTPAPTPSETARDIHAFLNPKNEQEYSPNPSVVKSVDYVPPPLPHFQWHLSTFYCSAFWRNVYIFAAASVPFGFLMVSSQFLQSFSEKAGITPSEGLLRSFGALFSNSFLPVMWGVRSNPYEFPSTFAARAQQDGHSEANRNRIVCTAVVAEHCSRKGSNPVWEYVNYFGSNVAKKGRNLLFDWDDVAYSRLSLLLQLLSDNSPLSPCREDSRRACFGQVVNCVLADMGDDIRRFYMQVSGEEFTLESARLWGRAKDTFFGIETKLFHELKDSTMALFMRTVAKDPEAICLLRGDSQLASSLPIESLSSILYSLLDPFTHFPPSSPFDPSVVDPALACYLLSKLPVTEYIKWIDVAAEKSESKVVRGAALKTLMLWKGLMSSGGGVTRLEPGLSRDYLDNVTLFLRLINLLLKRQGQQGFNVAELQECLLKILSYLRKTFMDSQPESHKIIFQIYEEAHSVLANIGEASYGEYESAMLEFPALSLQHGVLGKRETPKFSVEGSGLKHAIPLGYFKDVIRFAKYRLYHSVGESLLVPGPTVGSISVLSSAMFTEQEQMYWQKLTKNLTSPDPMVRMTTFFFAGDPQNYVEDTTDMVAIPLSQPQDMGVRGKRGGGSMVITGVSQTERKKKGSSLPFNWGEEKPVPVRPLSAWTQKRDSTPILLSLLNWLLCPLPVTRKYAEEAKKGGGENRKIDEKAFQERVMKLQQKEAEKAAKKRCSRKKNVKSATEGTLEGAWENCTFDKVEGAVQWFLGRLFGARAVRCFSAISFSSKYFNNSVLRQVIRQVVLELSPTTAAHQFALFFSLPLSRDFLREGLLQLEYLFQSPPLQYGAGKGEGASAEEGDPVDLCLAELLLLLLQEKLPVGVQDSLLSCLSSILWRIPKRYLSSVVRQFLRAVRSVLPRPVDEGEALQHYIISPGHRMLFEVTVLAFDQVACGVENKKICPTTRARARLIVKNSLREQDCSEALVAIAQAASSDKTTPSHCVASLLMLLDLAEATDAPVFGRLLKQLFEKNCPMARQKSLFILSRLPAAQVPQLLDVLLPAALNPLPKLRTTDITLRHAIGVRSLALSAITLLVNVHPDHVLPTLYYFLFEGKSDESIPEAYRDVELSAHLEEIFKKHMEMGASEAKRTLIRALWDAPPHLWALSMQNPLMDLLASSNPDDVAAALDMVLAIATWVVRIRNRTSRHGYRGNLWASNSSFGGQENAPMSLSLKNQREPQNERILELLQEIGVMLKGLTPTVAQLLAHECLGVRSNAFRCLSTLGPIPGVFQDPETKEEILALLALKDHDVVEMTLRVISTCVGDNDGGEMWSLQFDREVLVHVVQAAEHSSLMVRKASVKLFGSLLWTAQRLCERNNVDISKGQDNEANSQVHPAVVVQKAKDCLRGLMGSKNASLQLQVLKVLCEVPLVHAVTFVQQVIQLCNREFSVPMVKAKAIFFFARTGCASESAVTSTIYSVISFKETEVLGECLSTLSAVGCFVALHIPTIIAKLKKKSEAQLRRKLAMFLLRFDQENRMRNHVSTLHKYQPQEISSRGGFAINFEKSWKGDVEEFPCDIEAASQALPPYKLKDAVETARLDGWGLFPTAKIQALETLSQDDDYMIRRTAIRILGQSAHLYSPILRKIIQFAFFDTHLQIQGFSLDIMGSVGARRSYLIPEILSRCALLDANNPEASGGRGKARVWQRLSSQWRLCVPGGRSHSPAK